MEMDPLFEVHTLNDEGKRKANDIANSFNMLLGHLNAVCIEGRCFAICKTKLEEACMFAKKSMASKLENRQ